MPPRSARLNSLLGLVMAAGIAATAAQTPRQAPVFRTGVDLITLDVTALDGARRPVRGLTAADFTVLENGVSQPISTFAAFDVAAAAPPPSTRWMRDVAADITTNDLSESRLFVLVIDDALIPGDARIAADAKSIARGLIDRLAPADLMAVVFTGDNRRAQEFTGDRAKLLATLDKFSPGLATYHFGYDALPPGATGPPPVNTDAYFYSASVETLANVANFLIDVPQKRKVLFWLSPGVPLDVSMAGPQLAGGIENAPLSDGEIMRNLIARTQEVFRRAQRANVTIYPIDPAGLGGLEDYLRTRTKVPRDLVQAKATLALDFVAATAANTGGRAIVNTNAFEPAIGEIFDENSAYYLIGFQPREVAADGRLRRIEVRVHRPGVEVRTRSGYYAPSAENAARTPAASPETLALAKAIGGILPNPELPLEVTLAPFAVPGQRTSAVAVALGVRQLITASAQDRAVLETELQTSAFTPDGNPRGSQRHTARVLLRPGAAGEAEYDVLGRIDLAPGRYRLRLAAHNAAANKSGSVFADVEVPDFATQPLAASGVVLGAVPGRPSGPREALAPILPVIPTTLRDFMVSDRVTAFVRLYQSGRRSYAPVNLSIRIVDRHDVTRVTHAEALAVDRFAGETPPAPIAELPRGRGAAQTRPNAAEVVNPGLRSADVRFVIPFDRLGPGPHLLTFEANSGDARVRRDVRFSVR
jgi:VWFA-related protein